MSDVPPDIIKLILTRLPVKSLLRFRCVSKSWRSLIDSKDFIKLHLHQSCKTNSNGAVLVDTNRLHYVDLDSFELLDIGNPQIEPYSVLCSCNGLALVVPDSEEILMWNPVTRKTNKLPTPPSKSFEAYGFVQQRFALGYDSKRDDYKVVRVIQAYSALGYSLLSSEIRIYSLKSNSWKKVKNLPYVLPPDKVWGVYLNDALHTVVRSGRNLEVIMAFDLGKEEHYEVPMPKSSKQRRGLSSVEVMAGCLTAVIPGKKNCSEIWVMKEYGVKDSWIKLLCFYPPISEPCINLCPLAYSKSGDEVLLDYEGLCLNWYNLKKKSVMIACVNGLTCSFDTHPFAPRFRSLFFVGSLVSPCRAGVVAIEKQKGKGIKRKWDEMPPEIIKDILSRLPVKSLLCLRCVSKSWCSWIDSKDFIQQHLQHSFKTKSNRSLIVDSSSQHLFCVDLESFKRLDIGNSQLGLFRTKTLAGSCNGLALIVSDWDNLVLWNPFTRKQNKLPTKPIDCPEPNEIYFALGYDSKKNDYKVLRVVQACHQVEDRVPLPLETLIYSLKTNSWRRVQNFPYLLSNDRRWGVYTNDALHSVVKDSNNSDVIMAFDIRKEKHRVVPIPEFNTQGRALWTVEVMEGFLAAIIFKEENNGEIWVMKEYGVKDSWMKLLCFEPPDCEFCISVCPLAYSKNNDEVLVNYDGICLTWYDFKNDSAPLTIGCEDGLSLMMDVMALDPPFFVEACVESLVSPHSPAVVATEKHKGGQGKKEIMKKRDDFLSVGFKLVL
ncbi:hypothetical protein ACS0TY_032906 [Phlomoides rotata]